MQYDVAIIGGGPAGSTTGSILKKYHPEAKVLILEREHFPRPHVGESQLPPITQVLEEMGCWHKVEAADFPAKVQVAAVTATVRITNGAHEAVGSGVIIGSKGDFVYIPAHVVHREENLSESAELHVLVTRNCPGPKTIVLFKENA